MRMKGLSIGDLAAVSLSFVLIGVVGAIGVYINTNVATQIATPTNAANFSLGNATSGISTLLQWLPIIAIVLAAGIVITVLVTAFVVKNQAV